MIATTSRMDPPARHATSPADFVAAAFGAFERAAAGSGQHDRHIQVAGRVIRLRFAGEALMPAVMPALAHLEVDHGPSSGPALDVALFESETTGVRMPPPAWGPFDWGAKGEIKGFNDERIRTVYQPGADILHLFDADRAAAVYWTRTRRTIPWWESSFPLRTILHWWAARLSLQPTHAGAVARDGVGVLVAGESGAGKSTTTLACLEGGLGYLGDDYVMVDVDEPSVHSLYSTAKLEPENLGRFPLLAPLVANLDDLDVQKAMLMLHDHRPGQLRLDAALRAIVLPRITSARGTDLTPIPASAAMASLAPTTLFHLPGFGRQIVGKFGRLVRSVPCYQLDVGQDMDEIANTVGDLLDELR